MTSSNNDGKSEYSYGPPTQSGKVKFTPPGTDLTCETAYWLWGDLTSKSPPLIVLHGGPAAPGRDWQAVATLYEKYGVPVLLYDQIGGGASTHLPETKGDTGFWKLELFHAELDNLKTHFKIETFDLVGHSNGGIIAITYALTQPPGLRKLVIASSSPSEALRVHGQMRWREQLPKEHRDAMIACEEEGRLDAPEYGRAMAFYMHHHLCLLNPWPPEVNEAFALLMEDDTVPSTLYGGMPMAPTGPMKDFDVIDRLSEITDETTPGGVLLTNGKYDMSSDAGMLPFFLQIRARVKWVRFAESSHVPHLEEPQAYLSTLGEFLTAV